MRLDNVLYVLELRSKILSLGRFIEHGCQILIEGGFITIYDHHGRLLIKVKKTLSKLYLLKQNPVLRCIVRDNSSNLTWTWHRRLMERDRVVIEYTWSSVKIKCPNLPILRIIHELRGIMVNKGRIHGELGKFLMISLNLIESDDKSMIEIGKMNIL